MNEYLVKFSRPVTFEGTPYNEIDLSGLNGLTTLQLKEADRLFTRDGNIAAMNEMTLGYACIVAHMASGLPLEFFDLLPGRDGIAVKNAVTRFFFSRD